MTFTFDGPGNRELPQIVGQLYVLPKHWWEGTDKSGRQRDVTATTLEPPLASGPYRIKDFVPGRSVVYERVKDHWGKALNVYVGQSNFDEVRFEYFRDSTVALEAFKGDQVDWRTENSAKNWATAYDFPAVKDKRVVLEEFPIRNFGVMQAFAFNIRRDKFKDARLRRAFNFAFDFEEMNKQIFFGQYRRIASYFEGTELASAGLPQGKELEILETVRDKVPAEVFTTAYANPVGGNPENVRGNLRESIRLLKEAGYEIRNTRLVNAKTGEPLSVEFLVDDPSTERFVLFYKPSLERLGIVANVRVVDAAQYENRLRQWDFDIIVTSWGESLSPGNEQRGFWGSQAADQPGSRNLVGIKNPAIDALIERVIFTKDRDDLVAATKALDRVLLWNFYVVPQWTYGKVRSARWDRFGRPDACRNTGQRPSRRSGGGTSKKRPRRRVHNGTIHPPERLGPCWRRGCGRRGAQSHSSRSVRRGRASRHVGVRRSQISSRFCPIQLCRYQCAERRHVLADRAGPAVQSVVPDLQFAQQLHPQRRRRPGHGMDLCYADGALGR